MGKSIILKNENRFENEIIRCKNDQLCHNMGQGEPYGTKGSIFMGQ